MSGETRDARRELGAESTGETPVPPGDGEGAATESGRVLAPALHPEEIRTTADELIPLLTRLKTEGPEPYARLTDICGVDRGERLEVVYSLCQGYTAGRLLVKLDLPRRNAEVPTATKLWPLAEWAERETGEMFGIKFTGHPRPEHLLLPEDFVGYPLLKDYVYDRDNPLMSPDPLRDDPDAVLGTPAEAASAPEEEPAES
jgi:NADH-quinone oxidoreductase subunit C